MNTLLLTVKQMRVVIGLMFAALLLVPSAFARSDNSFRGDLTERYADYVNTSRYSYQPAGWEKLNSKVGSHGIDHLYVKRDAGGVVNKVFILESKYGGSNLGLTHAGRQMSFDWTNAKIDERITKLNREIDLSFRQTTKLRLEKELADMNIVKTFVSKECARRQVWKTKFEDGRLHISRYKVADVGGRNLNLNKIETRGELRNGVIVDGDEIKRLPSAKSRAFHYREREKFFTVVKRDLKIEGLSRSQAKEIVVKMRTGEIRNMHQLSRSSKNMLLKKELYLAAEQLQVGRLVLSRYAPYRLRPVFSKSFRRMEHNPALLKLLTRMRIVPYVIFVVQTIREFDYIWSWANNTLSTRQFVRKSTALGGMTAGAVAGGKVGTFVGATVGGICGGAVDFFTAGATGGGGTVVGAKAGAIAGGLTGVAVGGYLGEKAAQGGLDAYYGIQGEADEMAYRDFLREYLENQKKLCLLNVPASI